MSHISFVLVEIKQIGNRYFVKEMFGNIIKGNFKTYDLAKAWADQNGYPVSGNDSI